MTVSPDWRYFFTRGIKNVEQTTISRGFDWLGAWFEPGAVGLAPRSVRLHRERCLRLYEQTSRQGLTHEKSMARVQAYRKRWFIHARKLLP